MSDPTITVTPDPILGDLCTHVRAEVNGIGAETTCEKRHTSGVIRALVAMLRNVPIEQEKKT